MHEMDSMPTLILHCFKMNVRVYSLFMRMEVDIRYVKFSLELLMNKFFFSTFTFLYLLGQKKKELFIFILQNYYTELFSSNLTKSFEQAILSRLNFRHCLFEYRFSLTLLLYCYNQWNYRAQIKDLIFRFVTENIFITRGT